MINVDISNIWGEFSLPNLLAMEREVFDAHKALDEGTGAGSRMLGWLQLPLRADSEEVTRLLAAAERLRTISEICVVVGIGGACLGAQGAIELLQGPDRNLGRGKGDPMVIFAGDSLSTRRKRELEKLLEGKDFSVIAISKSGTTMEPALAFRGLHWLLERRYGTDGAKERIVAVTDPIQGALRQMAQEQGWETFTFPIRVGGRYAVLTAPGLLPMAVAGIDIRALLRGAEEAKESYDLRSYENPVWLYAAVRNMVHRRGKSIEILGSFEPGFRDLGRWWQHLFSESEGKEGKGLFPVPAEYPSDLHVLGQMIQDGQRNLFETLIRFDPPEEQAEVQADERNPDGLNCLAGRGLDDIAELAHQGALEAHADGGVPVLTVDCGTLNEEALGELFCFMELGCALSGYILEVNPFNQPGAEPYKRNLNALLGRPSGLR